MSDTTTSEQNQGTGSTVWRKSPETKGSDRPVLLGARIRPDWLGQNVSLLSVRFVGPLGMSLQALLEAAKSNEEKNLPILRLRSALMAKLEGVVRLDKHLGLKNQDKPALELRWAFPRDSSDEECNEIKQEVVEVLMRWHLDVVGPWAERNGLGDAAVQVRASIASGNIDLQHRSQPLVERNSVGQVSKPQFDLIAKHLAERLVGEELFPGLGPCELVADAASLDGSVELITWPKQVPGHKPLFSMAARLSVGTWPTSKEIHLKVTPVKRVWAEKVPGRKPNAPSSVTCYIFSPEMHVLPASIRRGNDGWEFGDEYIQYRLESDRALPETLTDALANLLPDESGWWVGLPELTTLFDYVQQRTVFESDEVDLYDEIVELLPDVLDPALPCRVLKMPRAMNQAKSEVARLQVSDVMPSDAAELGWAGAALSDEAAAAGTGDEQEDGEVAGDDPAKETKRRERLAHHRSANEDALARIHGSKTPSLWVFVDGTDERNLIERCARAIFGDRLRLEFSPLPQGVHGLRTDLDEPGEKGVRRFEARVNRWAGVADRVAQGADGARHVLICAPKDVNRRPEDPVNYFAGLHAMCSRAKANVHHLLPLELDRKSQQPDVQHFIHRVQSALLDVFMAHSGVVFGVQPFVTGCLGDAAPKAIYGIQVVRSQARAFTQEQPVCLILFTRLDVASGVTSVRFVCRNKNRTQPTDWETLNQGLQWLGTQRQLSGDERWARENFADATRKMLGHIGEEDPRAIVLVDWSTVAGLWKELTDESLTSGNGRGVVLDDAEFGTRFASMTFLRLRSDRNATMVMRWVNTTAFEEWRTEPQLEPTRQTTEEQYATTYKTIVELDESAGSRLHPHYLMVMGYRSTVQTKRGMSCYRPMWRMSRNASGWYERRTLPVAKDNAALPSGLEVTVLQAPSDVQPDNLARLVMGLRLGYAHYDDWTALPAPLFFVSKVRDYIIRYPEAPEAEAEEPLPAAPDSPDRTREDAPRTDANASRAAELRSELVAEVLEALPDLEAAARCTPDNLALEVEQAEAAVIADAALAEAISDSATPAMEPAEPQPESLEDPALDRALKAALAAPELYSRKSGAVGKKLYEDMLLGKVQVRVEPPWFVTRESILPPGDWPTDKRAIGRYWRQLREFHIKLRPERGEAPSVATFPDWVLRRLGIPQSHYALDIAGVFPSSEKIFFHPINEAYDEFLDDTDSEEGDPARGKFWQDMPELVRWLCRNGDDEVLGWVFCLLAHYPYRDVVPKTLTATDPIALGPHARAALQYMIDCYDVCRKAFDERSSAERKVGVHLVHAPRPYAELALSQEFAPAIGVQETSSPFVQAPVPSFPVGSVSTPSELEKAPIAQAVAAMALAPVPRSDRTTPTPAPSIPPATGDLPWPAPGHPDFDALYDAHAQRLAQLRQQHDEILAVRAADLQLKEAEAAQRAAEEAALAAQQAALAARLDALDHEARALARAVVRGLEVGAWHAVDVRQMLGSHPSDADLAAIGVQLATVRQALDEAAAADAELTRVDSGQFEGAQLLAAKELRMRKATLLQVAAQRASNADDALVQALVGCLLLTSGEMNETAGLASEPPVAEHEPAAHPTPVHLPAPADLTSADDVVPALQAQPPQPVATTSAKPESQQLAAPVPAPALAAMPILAPAVAPLESTGTEEAPPLAPYGDERAPQTSAAVTTEVFEEAEEEDEPPGPPTAGPVTLLEPAQSTLLACLQANRLALAQVAANALTEMMAGPAPRLWNAAVAGIRATYQRQPVDPATLAALDGWLTEQTADHAAANTFADHLGVLGASLLPMLLEGHDRGIRWAVIQYLRPRLQQHPDLHDIVERIASLESIHLVVTPEMLSAARVGLHQALEDGVRRMRQRAASWANDSSLVTNWTLGDYIELHAAMCAEKRGFVMGECVARIARGQDARARELLPEVLKLADKGLATISDLRKRIGRRKPIEGVGRDYLVNNLKATAQFVQEYFEQLDRLEGSKQDSLPPKHKDFLQGLFRELQAAQAYVQALELDEGAPAVHRAVLLCALNRALALMSQAEDTVSVSEEDQLLLLEHPLGRDLQPTLSWRPTDDPATRVPVGDLAALVAATARAERDLRPRTGATSTGELPSLLLGAAKAHRAAERLLPARLIEDRLSKLAKSLLPGLVADNETAQREARSKLSADLQEAKQRVTNAMSLNALPQAEASRMLKVIESLVRSNSTQEIGSPAKMSAVYADYPQARAVLQHLVLTPLDTKIQQSRAQLEREIDELVKERKERNLEPLEMRQFEQKAQLIRARLATGTALSVRVARNEFLLLREDKLPLLKFEERTASHRFDEFRAQVRKVTQGHRPLEGLHDILREVAPVPTGAPEWLTSMGDLERVEAAEFIASWVSVFKGRPRGEFADALQSFFGAAGVTQQPTVVQRNEGKFFFEGKPFAGLAASGFGVFIPPALGSDATHIEGVVVPQPASIGQLSQSLAQLPPLTPSFILSRQNLTLQQRAQLGHEQPVLLVDDDLVGYMAVHAATRLAKLMEVCLLSFYTNPYADYGARPVPPEMFFGRKGELRMLREVPSAAVLYGGRRLGKSSLLNQILEESKSHVRLVSGGVGSGEMAIYVPLDSGKDPAGFSQNYRLFSWKAIHKAMVTAGFLSQSPNELTSDQAVRDRIHDEIMAGRAATNACYLLIDEADDVMREDLQGNAPFLANLQNLSETVLSRCRLRYVIAGLHNLTRMTTGGNTALGKATSIALQPFSSDTDILNGIDLITKPLASLGFHFGKGDESLPMRIMAVCNFYPAFIQLYCRNLVRRLYNKRGGKELPTMIGSADLDAVERDQDFLREIQEKFGLNLNLDKRYKAIALILAEYSYAEPAGGVFTGLTATEIRDHCVAYAPEHFKTTAPGAYEALLDEMEKLTVLERNGSRFQLRTPDIATMLGDKDQVAHLLIELAREKPTDERSRGEARLLVRHKHDTKTFPAPSAWVRNYLQGDASELVVFVGNTLSGIATFDRLRETWDVGQEEATIEGRTFNNPDEARTWINKERKKPCAARSRLIVVVPRGWRLDQLDTYAGVAQTFGKQSGQSDSSLRVRPTTMRQLLVASPEQALALAERVADASKPLPRNVVVEPIPAWSDDAVYFRLDRLENQAVRDSAEARLALLRASCGFGDELERICVAAITVEEALRQPEESRKRLASDLDSFYAKIGLPSRISEPTRARLEDLLLLMHGEMRGESKEFEHLDGLGLSSAHFLFAQWMGLIQPAVDGTWEVPALYLDLIDARPGTTA